MTVTSIHTDPNSPEAKKAQLEKLKKACVEFEAMFINQMMKVMRESDKKIKEENGEDGLGLGTDNPYQEMFDWKLSVQLSERSPLGIGKMMTEQMEKRLGIKSEAHLPIDGGELRRYEATQPHVETRKPLPKLPPELDDLVARIAIEQGLDPRLIHAVISAESGGNSRAVSPKGAKGLMQLIDSTAAEVGVRNPFDPVQNIRGGATYLKRMLDRYEGNKSLAVAAYNAGPGAVDRYGGIPPYPETVAYVRKIMQQLKSGAATTPSKPLPKENQ